MKRFAGYLWYWLTQGYRGSFLECFWWFVSLLFLVTFLTEVIIRSV